MRAIAQFTIHSLNDVIASTTAPENPYKGQLWVNTSYSPTRTYVYNGSAWKEQNGTDTLRSNVSTLTTKANNLETNLNGLTSEVSVLTQEVDNNTGSITTLNSQVSMLQQTATSIQASVTTNKNNISSLTVSVNSISTRVTTAEGDISTLTQTASSLATRLTTAEGNISTLTQTASSLQAEVSGKVDETYGSSSSTFGWQLKSTGFYVYSNATTVMSITSSGLAVTGAITATSGTMQNMTITGYLYFGGNTSYYISANYNDSNWYIYLPGFRVDNASTAVFSGRLSAPSGTIGGFTISSTSIYKTKTSYSSSTAGVYIGTDGIGLGAGTFYVTSAGYLYATSGKIGGMSLNASQMYSQNFILGTVYNSSDSSQSFTTLSFGTTSGDTFTATTVITNSGSYFQALSANVINCGVITAMSIVADPGISSTTGFYFGYSGGSTQYYAELSWSGAMLYLKIYNSSGVLTTLTSSKTFTVHYACIWGGDTTWNATVSSGSNQTSINTNAFWGIDYATFNYSSSNKSQHVYYFTVSGSSASTTITCYGHIVPYYNNTYNLGSAAYKWDNIFGRAGIVNTSDRNEKMEIVSLPEVYDRIFDGLVPVSFKYKDTTSGRIHTGLIAQDVKDAVLAQGLTTVEFAGYCEWENEDGSVGCGLRYNEFVALNIYEIQQLKNQVKQLQNKIKILEGSNET